MIPSVLKKMDWNLVAHAPELVDLYVSMMMKCLLLGGGGASPFSPSVDFWVKAPGGGEHDAFCFGCLLVSPHMHFHPNFFEMQMNYVDTLDQECL